MCSVPFFLGTTTIELICGMGFSTRVMMPCWVRSSNVFEYFSEWYGDPSLGMLHGVDTVIQPNVVLILQETDSLTEDGGVLLEELLH